MQEYRSNPRVRYPVDVKLLVSEQESHGRMRDLSPSGAFVEVEGAALGAIALGQLVRLRFALEPLGVTEFDAYVRWTSDQGAGLHFANPTAKQTSALIALLKTALMKAV